MSQTHPKRKGLTAQTAKGGPGVVTEFTCIAPVIPGHEQAVRDAIKTYTSGPRRFEALKQAGVLSVAGKPPVRASRSAH
jgi:hypothetical protein